MKYYAVKKGKNIGIYESWDKCKEQIQGYSGAIYKKFNTYEEAVEFCDLKENNYKNSDNIKIDSIKPNMKDITYAYVDGSFNKESNTVGYGLVLVKNDKVIIKDLGSFRGDNYSESRNVFGETRGAIKAVELALANNIKEICIAYDYIGIEKWATGEWKAKKELTKDYQDFMQKYMKHINVIFKKVKAHADVKNGGDKYNALADELAKKAANL